MHGMLKLRKMVQDDPDMGWRERYGAVGTEEPPQMCRCARRGLWVGEPQPVFQRQLSAPLTAPAGYEAFWCAERLMRRGLELLARELWRARGIETVYFRKRATIVVVPTEIRAVLQTLRAQGYGFLASVHGVDHYPEEPRLGVVYELLDMSRVDRVTVKLRVPIMRREWSR